jgi:hypothetical protein
MINLCHRQGVKGVDYTIKTQYPVYVLKIELE